MDVLSLFSGPFDSPGCARPLTEKEDPRSVPNGKAPENDL